MVACNQAHTYSFYVSDPSKQSTHTCIHNINYLICGCGVSEDNETDIHTLTLAASFFQNVSSASCVFEDISLRYRVSAVKVSD